MDYTFFNPPTKKQKVLLKMSSPVNKLFTRLRWNIEISKAPDAAGEMITVEQRINLFHLINEVLVHRIEGDFVEFGCHTGNSAIQIQTMLVDFNSQKEFHVYDKFNLTPNPYRDIKEILIQNFRKANVKLPCIHEGFFKQTVPSELPSSLAFIHIDTGHGGNPANHRDDILHLLEHVYTRMSSNAICLLMDYHDVDKTMRGTNCNPGVKAACDVFFEKRPEKVQVLYGNHFSHAYFRKS